MPQSSTPVLMVSENDIIIPDSIAALTRENVVMHIATAFYPDTSFQRRMFGQRPTSISAESSQTKTQGLPLKLFSVSDCDSPFSHMRITTPSDGKVCIVERFPFNTGQRYLSDGGLFSFLSFQNEKTSSAPENTPIVRPTCPRSGFFLGRVWVNQAGRVRSPPQTLSSGEDSKPHSVKRSRNIPLLRFRIAFQELQSTWRTRQSRSALTSDQQERRRQR